MPDKFQRSVRPPTFKYFLLAGVVAGVVAADQYTKGWANRWLASPFTDPPNPVVFKVPAAADGRPLSEAVASVLTASSPEEVAQMIARHARLDGVRPSGPGQVVKAGQEIRIAYRAIEVVPNVFHLKYARNPGAAFGLMSDMAPAVRRWFFLAVSILAVVLIGSLYRNVQDGQRLLQVSLALILAGAIGNFIDRIRYQYVIDFIDWHWKDVYHWPTFNIADSAITVGVVVLFLEMFFSRP